MSNDETLVVTEARALNANGWKLFPGFTMADAAKAIAVERCRMKYVGENPKHEPIGEYLLPYDLVVEVRQNEGPITQIICRCEIECDVWIPRQDGVELEDRWELT